jgi:3-dehydroquinate dehydratase-1
MALCVSVGERALDGVLSALAQLQGQELAEVRIDLVSARGPHNDGVADGGALAGLGEAELARVWAHPARKIATCRDLGRRAGGAGFTAERRAELERAIMSGGVAMVDIEFEAPAAYREALLACAAKHKVEAVISYHNYVETPVDLAAIVDTCFAQGASIAKVAVMARSAQDSARVLALYGSHYGAARRIVALAMGAPGMITRVAALSLGAPFTFVALSEASATAPGQLTLDEMRQINHRMARSGHVAR